MTVCTLNARTPASEACIKDLMLQARKIKYDFIRMTETRNALSGTRGEVSLGICERRGVGGGGVFVNTRLAMNIDPHESLTTRIGLFRMSRSGSPPALTIFVVYAPTSSCDEEELQSFYMRPNKATKKRNWKRFMWIWRENHTFSKVIVGDFNAKIGQRRTVEELHIGTHGMEWNEQGKNLFEFHVDAHYPW
nr:endonuclease-reverse transcriptase [Haemonchus contortus]